MFELPELLNLASQINRHLSGKTVAEGCLGNSPHKFVWYNHSHEEFARLIQGKRIGKADVLGCWLRVEADPGMMLVFGEMGGKLLFHPNCAKVPAKYHLLLSFTDASHLSLTIQMWGAVELYPKGDELHRKYIQGMATTPEQEAFSLDYFQDLVARCVAGEKRSVKSLLTQDQLIPGLGNSIAQDIMFAAGLHPKHTLSELSPAQVGALHASIVRLLEDITAKGGRNDETDLLGAPGGYVRVLSKDTVGKPCPACGATIQKMAYLGGTTYFCPHCQV